MGVKTRKFSALRADIFPDPPLFTPGRSPWTLLLRWGEGRGGKRKGREGKVGEGRRRKGGKGKGGEGREREVGRKGKGQDDCYSKLFLGPGS